MKTILDEQPLFDVGSRITFFRTQKGISTNKLANLAGISQSYLRDIELGNKNPTVEVVYILCQALDISLCQFFDDKCSETILEDPLINQIYKLNSEQKNSLLDFLKTFTK